MNYRAYPKYKSTVSTWLGKLPEHWDIKKLKFLAAVQPSNVDKNTVEGEEPVLLCNYTDVYKNEYIDSRLEFMQASATAAEIRKFKVDVGDVIVTKDSETSDDIAIPACVVENIEGLICGYHLTQIKPIDLHGPYLFRLFQSKGFNAQFVVAANGVTRFGLPQYAIANALTALPPLNEQQSIARFLDLKTAQIDALIAKQRLLLDKLAEKRTALISHAVTKGLDPSVPMKDSGVEWLGEIPAHWEVSMLKRRWSVTDCKHLTADFTDEGYPLASIREVQGKWIVLKDANRTTDYFYHLLIEGGRRPLPGDLIFSRNVIVGEVAQVHEDLPMFAMGQDVVLLRKLSSDFSSDFLQHALKSPLTKDQLSLYMIGSTFKRINVEEIRTLLVAIPPPVEQRAICEYLEPLLEKLEDQRRKVDLIVRRLQEYRSALITNAVTGKIDVRDWRPPEASA